MKYKRWFVEVYIRLFLVFVKVFIIILIYCFFDNYYFLFDIVLVVIGFFLFMNSNDIYIGFLINYMLIMGL